MVAAPKDRAGDKIPNRENGLVRRGEALFVIDVRDGGLRMLEASSWDVSGGHDPSSWVYRVDLPGPSVTASRRYPAASVIHVRFAVHPSSPWRGVSPLEWARLYRATRG